jgi:hypothetical protein
MRKMIGGITVVVGALAVTAAPASAAIELNLGACVQAVARDDPQFVADFSPARNFLGPLIVVSTSQGQIEVHPGQWEGWGGCDPRGAD